MLDGGIEQDALHIWTVVVPVIALLLQIVGAIAALLSLKTARTPQGAVVWVLFLLVLPLIAIPIYVVLGHSRYPGYVSARRSSKTMMRSLTELRNENPPDYEATGTRLKPYMRGFETMTGLPLTSGNAVRLLIDGEAAFDAIFAAIDAAEHYILVQYYLILHDRIGTEFQQRLIRKAESGCKVRFLYDSLGSHGLDSGYLQALRDAGVLVENFHSIRRASNRLQINFRNHRKIVVVDGTIGFVGGLNVGDEYLGRSTFFGPWRDTHAELKGPVVSELQQVFSEDWSWATDEKPELNWNAGAQPENLNAMIVAPGPADELETGSMYFCNAINAAHSRVWIATPYFVPDTDVQTALCVAAQRGVEVRLLVPQRRDHWLVWLAAYAYFDRMLDAGVSLFHYQEGFMHQKVILVDDCLASVGSINLDNRSCQLNFEATAVVLDKGFAAKVEEMLLADFARAAPYVIRLDDMPSLFKRYGARVARLFAPIL